MQKYVPSKVKFKYEDVFPFAFFVITTTKSFNMYKQMYINNLKYK